MLRPYARDNASQLHHVTPDLDPELAQHKWFAFRLHSGCLVRGREEAVGKILQASWGHGSRMQQDVARQILILTAQAITQPGSHTRAISLLRSCLEKSQRRIVVDCFRKHTFYKTQIIHYF